ncbi:Protein of unknown function [Pyronema omphalodes CBS 100304]|uniref:Uncharacterized protein n=1 Tax=Pyronema omphalodes (strain CBS 100304) TaxID=1076935 RepID=U4LFB4_PYROM|nr:Protein of unknown function [Pyronema omphalodes CBS 100304]
MTQFTDLSISPTEGLRITLHNLPSSPPCQNPGYVPSRTLRPHLHPSSKPSTPPTSPALGFLALRTFYSNPSLWSQFQQHFTDLLSSQLTPSNGTGIPSVVNEFQIIWIEDPSLEEASMEDIRVYVSNMKERGSVPQGMDWSMVLVADEAAAVSVVEALKGQKSKKAVPWVIGLDVDYGEGEEEEVYEGFFKVAVQTLLTELFPVLATQMMAPSEMVAGIDWELGVWIWG